MQVSELANNLDISTDTVRYYSRIGLLKPERGRNGYRHYSKVDSHKLRFVLRAKRLGFSLVDIRKLIDVSEHGDSPCPLAKLIVSKNVDRLGIEIEESIALYKRMKSAVKVWDSLSDKQPDGHTICALIEGLEEKDE